MIRDFSESGRRSCFMALGAHDPTEADMQEVNQPHVLDLCKKNSSPKPSRLTSPRQAVPEYGATTHPVALYNATALVIASAGVRLSTVIGTSRVKSIK